MYFTHKHCVQLLWVVTSFLYENACYHTHVTLLHEKVLIVPKNACHGRAHWSCKNNCSISKNTDVVQSFSGFCNICLASDIPSILYLTGRDSHNPGFVANLRTLYLQWHVIWIRSPAVSSLSAKPICFHVVFNFQCTENYRLPKEQCYRAGLCYMSSPTGDPPGIYVRGSRSRGKRFSHKHVFYNLFASPLSVPPGTFTPESTHTSFLRFS